MSTFPKDKRYTSGTTRLQTRSKASTNPYNDKDFKKANRVILDLGYVFDAPGDPFPIRKTDLEGIARETMAAHKSLLSGKGDFLDGNTPMLGWQDLPLHTKDEYLDEITQAARKLAKKIDAFVSIGIGGSYLGIDAAIKTLTHTHYNQLTRKQRGNLPEVYFLGQNMDPDYFCDTLEMLSGKRVALNIISKSGTTTEPAVAFRILRSLLEKGLGEKASEFIVATTDRQKGALRKLANAKGYKTYVVPDDVGGRFSVLTDVGLLGIAMAGIDLKELFAGARDMRKRCITSNFLKNPAMAHAAVRTLAWRKGKKIEVVATNSQALLQVAKWMEQLFPESECHDGVGLWVSSSMYSEKLHANGQAVQDGERNLIETFLKLDNTHSKAPIPVDPDDLDGLNYLPEADRDMGFLNGLIVEGPAFAHYNGGVPNMTVQVPAKNAYCLGQLFYMMERSVAISGVMMGLNPFVQPGVEAYKKAMFALAGKPGSGEEAARIQKKIASMERIII